MRFITIIGILTIIFFCSCSEQTTKKQQQIKTGLTIEYKPTRGQSYIDTIGTKYNLRHIPVILTNDSTIPIHIQIAFKKKYDYPITYNDKQFKVFPMPEEWALDGIETTDSMLKELPKYIDKPFLEKTIQPGKKWLLGIGTRYPSPINYGVFPIAAFSYDNRVLYHECNQLINPNELTIPPLELKLLLGFTSGSQASPDSCAIIPFGQISYPQH